MHEVPINEMVVMVTGAAGHLGGAVVKELSSNSARVVAVERNLGADLASKSRSGGQLLEIEGIDLTDLTACQEAWLRPRS